MVFIMVGIAPVKTVAQAMGLAAEVAERRIKSKLVTLMRKRKEKTLKLALTDRLSWY